MHPVSIPSFNEAQVLIVGDVMLDRYWHGATKRVSPEAPVPVVKVEKREDRLGGAANVALNVAALGASVSLHAAVGDDPDAQILRQALEAVNIEANLLPVAEETICKLRVISRNQQLLRMDFEQALPQVQSQAVLDSVNLDAVASQKTVVVLSDYNKGVLNDVQSFIQQCRQKNLTVVVDPKGTDFERYRGASLLTPNKHELEAVVGSFETDAELQTKALQLIEQLDLDALLVTRGSKGMSLIRPGHDWLHLPAKAHEVYDVTGAGDTVIATLSAALACGEDYPNAVALANLAASVVVGKLGTASISLPELRRLLSQEGEIGRGVMNAEQLVHAVEHAREQGKKIVMTNGCFDIIHAGHVGYLKQAKALGDLLLVAINSDASVKRLKGSGRPINQLEQRLAVLSGLESVDWVVGFEEDTPTRLIEIIKPDVLVKGGDYSKDEVVGGDIVSAYGGQVEVLDVWQDLSTTAIVNKIAKN